MKQMALDEQSRSKEKVFIVFGGTGGIGSAVAKHLVSIGYTVVITGRNKTSLEQCIRDMGVDGHQVDVAEQGSIDACISQTFEKYGRVDGVVNCIGSLLLKPAHLITDQEWHSVIDMNLTSSFKIVRAAAGAMMRGGGSIVLLSSAAATVGLASHEAISAAKAGIEGLAVAAAASYARRNIRVNCVAPGLIETKLTRHLLSTESARRSSDDMHALGRVGSPEYVASAITWLLSEENSWVTGQTFRIDGGLSNLRPRVASK
ncbi:SDR family oxidoreductase [Candidatus Obscuribacterales bacterium]|nr:SDR family oxidoreductase [Candidatus Obscuribacterales bacterium]